MRTTITLLLLWCLWNQVSHPGEPPFRPWTPTDDVFASQRDCERGIADKIEWLRSGPPGLGWPEGLDWPLVALSETVVWLYTPGKVRVIEYACHPPRDPEWQRVG